MLNTVVLQGRLTDHPERRLTNSGVEVCHFTIANETGWGDNKRTNFINCIAWRKTAEFICNHFSKGDMIGVQGQLIQNKYTTKDGENRTTYEVTVTEAAFMGAPKKEEAPAEEQQPLYTAENAPQFEDVTEDDDLPF